MRVFLVDDFQIFNMVISLSVCLSVCLSVMFYLTKVLNKEVDFWYAGRISIYVLFFITCRRLLTLPPAPTHFLPWTPLGAFSSPDP